MKLFKKISLLILCVALTFSFAGCAPAEIVGLINQAKDTVKSAAGEILSDISDTSASAGDVKAAQSQNPSPTGAVAGIDEQKRFDAFLDEWLKEFEDLDSINKKFLFSEPTNESGAPQAYEPVTKQSWDEDVADTQAKLDELNGFDTNRLNEESKLTLAVLKDVVERTLLNKDYYYLYNNYLNLDGDLMQMPTWLSALNINNAQDVKSVFDMYSQLPEMCDNYISLEEERQQNGAGLSKLSMASSVKGAQDIINSNPNLFETVMNAKIDAANNLTDAEKESYKKQNAQLVAEKVIPSYKKVVEALNDYIDKYGTEPDFVGLAARKDGIEYFSALLRQKGIDMTPVQAMEYLKLQFEYYQDEIFALLESDSNLISKYIDSIGGGYTLTNNNTSEDIIDMLAQEIKADFPDIGQVPYTTHTVADELRLPNTQAFYILRPVDQPEGESATIYINSEDSGSDFLTLAHESFPGHMYQDTYMHMLGRPQVRMIMDRGLDAFTEGWGIYSEVISADYADADKVFARVMAIDRLANGIVMAYADIGVNYYGWSKEETIEQLNDTFGLSLTNNGEFDAVYEMICESPGQLVAYYLGGSRLLDYRIYTEKQLGDAFSAKDYHSAILNVAPASLTMIEDAVENYVQSVKNGAAAATQQAA